MRSQTNSTLTVSIALAISVAAACSQAPGDGTDELADSLERSSTTAVDQSSETDTTDLSSPPTSAQPTAVPTSGGTQDDPPVLDGLVVADPIETVGGSAVLAQADVGFLMITSDANAPSVRRSADGREWSTIQSDLSLWFNGPMASDGDRVVVYGWREGDDRPTLWTTDDGGHTWTSLPAFPTSESDAAYVIRPTGVGELAVRGDRVVTVVAEPTEIDWRAYSVDQLGEDHGAVTATWPGFGNELTVSFEDGFELTLDTTTLGLPPEGQSPDDPLVAYSYDGDTWTRTELQWPIGDSYHVVSGPAGFAAIVGQPEAQVILSDDGITWTAQPVPAPLDRPVALAGSPFGYVIADSTTVMFSDDGSTWEVVYESDDVDPALSGPRLAAGGPAGFVLVDVPFSSTSPARATWSADGRSWQESHLDLVPMDQGGSVAAAVGDSTALLVPLTIAPDPSSVPGGPAPGVIPSGPCADGEYPALGAFDLADGTLEWSLCSDEQVYRTVIGVTDELVVVQETATFPDVRVVAYDSAGDGERWRIPMVRSAVRGSGTLDDVLVLQVEDGESSHSIGVELATGAQLWASEPGVTLVAQTSDVAVLARSGAPEDQVVSGGLIGVDPTSGAARWTNDDVIHQNQGNGTGGAISGRVLALPTFSVDVPPPGDAFTAVDLDTGAVLWTAPTLPNAIGADDVFVGIGDGGDIRVVDRSAGATVWSGRAAAPYGGLLAVGDGVLVITDHSQDGEDLVAFELASGAERWRTPTSHVRPELVSDATVVSLWEAELVAVSTADGSTIWSATLPLGTPYMNNAVADDSTVYVAVNSLPWSD